MFPKVIFLACVTRHWRSSTRKKLSNPKFISRVVLSRVHCNGPVHLDRGVPVLQYYQKNVEVAWGSDYSMSSADSDAVPVFSREYLWKSKWIAPPGVRQRSIQLCCLNSLRRKENIYQKIGWTWNHVNEVKIGRETVLICLLMLRKCFRNFPPCKFNILRKQKYGFSRQ